VKKLLLKFLPLEFLLIISIIVYKEWFSFSVFSYADWVFRSNAAIKDFIFPSFWKGGVTLWEYPFRFLYGLFGQLGFDGNIAEKFLIFWPIAILGTIAGFLLTRKITNSNIAGFVGSLIFTYNTYFLSILTQGHVFLPLGFICCTFAFLSFIYLLETKKKLFIPITTLLLFASGSVDFRTFYIVSGVILLYFFYNQFFLEKNWRTQLKKNLSLFFSVFILLLILNIYWIIPNLTTGTLANNEFLNRPIIEGNFFNIQNVGSLFYPFWTGIETTWFVVQPILIHFWLFPIVAFLGLIVGRRNKQVFFFGLLALVGIFLAKQDSAPFGQIYNLFYDYIPGFSAFREAGKFYFLIVLSYSVLIGYFALWLFNYLENHKFAKYIIIFLIVLLPLWNTVPFLTGSIGTVFVPKTVPSDVEKLNTFLTGQDEYSRVFWINMDHRWDISSNKTPVISANVATLKNWKVSIEDLDKSIDLDSSNVEGEKLKTLFASEIGKKLLSLGSYGYVVITLKSNEHADSDISAKSWDSLREYLSTVDYLEQVNIDTESIAVFRNNNLRPLIYMTPEKESLHNEGTFKKSNFTTNNTSHYSITLDKKTEPFYLNFSEKYHPDWNMYEGKLDLVKFLLGQHKQLSNERHFKNAAGFNTFYIVPSEICNTYPCRLTLLFRPQGYLYIGLLISLVTLLITISSAIYFKKKL